MKKIPVTEPDEEKKEPPSSEEAPNERTDASTADGNESEQPDDGSEGLQADLERFRDLALRSQADFENFKKRSAREKEEAIKYANTSLLERLVAIVDNFELGLEAARNEGEKSPVFSGMSMVHKQLMDFLTDNGLQPIDAAGQKFDPNLHEAIAHEASDEAAEGTVIRQTRRGYRMKDRLLRPSSVVVSSGS
ncbi:MAG TPA: nucleotide exchange factor GrpE [Chthoniobacterales bacterium]|jgi:molecular chaperone GrpE|nr:nucleotide exchange factor GrpE [Chthoniobacterales bacterium]